jgi:hypothetical protein
MHKTYEIGFNFGTPKLENNFIWKPTISQLRLQFCKIYPAGYDRTMIDGPTHSKSVCLFSKAVHFLKGCLHALKHSLLRLPEENIAGGRQYHQKSAF